MKITIIGLGLMGGSVAMDLKKRGFAKKIIGYDKNSAHTDSAKKIGFVDTILPLEEAIIEANLIILCIPVDACIKILPQILDKINTQTVTDFCSTKQGLIKSIENHPKRMNFVPSHPMAGTEHSGPYAAIPNLFDGKCAILCDIHLSAKKSLQIVKKMYDTLNMKCIEMDSKQHDEHTAYISHISHISSFALALTVLEKEEDENNIFNLASGGFDSTVRLAKSSANMWTPIFKDNKENILVVLETYIQNLNLFKENIKNNEESKIHELINKSNKIKKIIN